MAYDVYKIANSLLRLADDQDDPMTNMKLQKMLYYEQGYHLVYFGTPLFDEEIEAWLYGPVVPSVYNKYKKHGHRQIDYDKRIPEVDFQDDKEYAMYIKVYNVFSIYSAIGLMNMTHEEDPWKNADVCKNEVIKKSTMREYFKTRMRR